MATPLSKMVWRAHIRALHPDPRFVYSSPKCGVFDCIKAFDIKDRPIGFWRSESDWQILEAPDQGRAAA